MNANQHTFRGARPAVIAGLFGLAAGFAAQLAAVAQETDGDASAPVTGIPEGYYLFEEDILLPVGRATYGGTLWPDGILAFEFDDNVTPDNQQRMLDAMAAWEAVAAVDFLPRSGHANYLYIFDGDSNYSEGVGMAGGQHDISIFNWIFGVLAHELGHAMGYWHEQSRADRDAYIQIEWDNISQTACFDGPCDSQFQIRGSGGEYGPYDFDSVMHYGPCAFTCCSNADPCEAVFCLPSTSPEECRTITVLPPYDVDWQTLIGQRSHLSVFDALTMSFLYPLSNWRFVDQAAGGSDAGTFQNPYRTLSRATTETPTGGTLWFLEPDDYSAVGTYSRAMTWRVGYGVVTLGN